MGSDNEGEKPTRRMFSGWESFHNVTGTKETHSDGMLERVVELDAVQLDEELQVLEETESVDQTPYL